MEDSFLLNCEREIVPYIRGTSPPHTKIRLTTPERASFIQNVGEALVEDGSRARLEEETFQARRAGRRNELNFGSAFYIEDGRDKSETKEAMKSSKSGTYRRKLTASEMQRRQELAKEWKERDERTTRSPIPTPISSVLSHRANINEIKPQDELLDTYDILFLPTITTTHRKVITSISAKYTEDDFIVLAPESPDFPERTRIRLCAKASKSLASASDEERLLHPLRGLRLKSPPKKSSDVAERKVLGFNLPTLGLSDMMSRLALPPLDMLKGSPDRRPQVQQRRPGVGFDDEVIPGLRGKGIYGPYGRYQFGIPPPLVVGKHKVVSADQAGDIISQQKNSAGIPESLIPKEKEISEEKELFVSKILKESCAPALDEQNAKKAKPRPRYAGRQQKTDKRKTRDIIISDKDYSVDIPERLTPKRKGSFDGKDAVVVVKSLKEDRRRRSKKQGEKQPKPEINHEEGNPRKDIREAGIRNLKYQTPDEEPLPAKPKVEPKHRKPLSRRPPHRRNSKNPNKNKDISNSGDEFPFAQI